MYIMLLQHYVIVNHKEFCYHHLISFSLTLAKMDRVVTVLLSYFANVNCYHIKKWLWKLCSELH